jgi:hypothetical protein
MSRLFALFMLMLLIGSHRPPADDEYFKTKALPGDGVYSLLRRYSLDRNSCNISKFYALNDLKNGTSLKVGSTYSTAHFALWILMEKPSVLRWESRTGKQQSR